MYYPKTFLNLTKIYFHRVFFSVFSLSTDIVLIQVPPFNTLNLTKNILRQFFFFSFSFSIFFTYWYHIRQRYLPRVGSDSLGFGLSGAVDADTPPIMAAMEKAVALDDSCTALAEEDISPVKLSVREFSSESISDFYSYFLNEFP